MAITVAGAQDGGSGDEEIVEGAASPKNKKAAAGASAQPSTPNSQLPTAEELLSEARERLESYGTLKAKMVEVIEFGPRRFKAEGIYLQGADNRLRLDLKVTLDNNSGGLLQVCDGDILWTVYDIGGTPRITRRDVTQILAAADQAGARGLASQELGLGGLPALLASAEEAMEFDPPIEATIEGRTFLVIQGTWAPEIMQLFREQAQRLPSPSEEPGPLPAHVPDFARIYFDAETKFPYRIRYLKKAPNPGGEPRPLLTLDFRDIVVNASIDPAEFRYSAPDGANVDDLTNYYLQKLQGAAAPTTPAAEPK